jgi:RNA polymerase sigma factor (sigma-70 family)
MAPKQLGATLRHLRSLAATGHCAARPDSDLLGAYLGGNDQDAFAALVRRHGPLVLGVCRRVLLDAHAAEDAFQATFLLLARNAAAIRKQSSLASWLYGVAYRVARSAKRSAARRRRHESEANAMRRTADSSDVSWREVQAVLDEELQKLPEIHRAAFVLCCLENRARAEAARELAVTEGTVWNRVARARKLLRERLAARGVTLSALLGVAALSESGLRAAVPAGLLRATVQAVSPPGADHPAAGVVSAEVLRLVKGANQAMLSTKAKLAALLLAFLGLTGAVLGLAGPQPGAGRAAAAQQQTATKGPTPGNEQGAAKAVAPRKPFVQWAATKEFASNGPHDPLFVKDRVVVGTDAGELRAYRGTDGAPLWTYQDGERIFDRPCSDGKRIYFTSASGVTAVTTDAGTKEWNNDRVRVGDPVIVLRDKGLVYVGGVDGNLYALDARTGAERWKADFLADAPPDPPNFPGHRARVAGLPARPTALASDGEALFLSVFDQSRVVAFDAATGKRLWSFQTGGWVYGEAVATATHVFFGSQDRAFYCLDKKTGKQIWRYATGGRIESGGVVDTTFVYFGSCDGSVYCLKQSDGKRRWQFATDRDQNGHKSAIYSVPVLSRGAVVFAAGEGQLYAVAQDTGRLRWKIRPSEQSELYSSAATDGTRFFVTTRPRGREQGESALVAVGVK